MSLTVVADAELVALVVGHVPNRRHRRHLTLPVEPPWEEELATIESYERDKAAGLLAPFDPSQPIAWAEPLPYVGPREPVTCGRPRSIRFVRRARASRRVRSSSRRSPGRLAGGDDPPPSRRRRLLFGGRS